MLRTTSTITRTDVKRIELTGVFQRGCSLVNQSGRRWSHPAVIGSREIPVKIRLAAAIARTSRKAIARDAITPPRLSVPNASRKAWGIGPIRLIDALPEYASTELVPRMNIIAMIGAEMTTDCPMVRAALRHS